MSSRSDLAIYTNVEDGREAWREIEARGSCLLFQSYDWCSTWLETAGRALGVEPCLVHVRDDAAEAELFLPLGVQRKRWGVRCLGFLGGRIADHSAPILAGANGPGLERGRLMALLREVQRIARSDVADFQNLVAQVEGRRNPLLGFGARSAAYRTYSLGIEGSWEAYSRRQLSATHRANSRRGWRRLKERGTPRFVIAESADRALELTRAMLAQKSDRLREAGDPDLLAAEHHRDFYLRSTRELHHSGLIHVSALMLDDRILAAHWGAVWRRRFLWLMPSHVGGEWSRYGPGRLLLEHLLEWCFAQGLQAFDFTIGDERYKRTYCNMTEELHRLVRPRSLLGWAYSVHSRLPMLRG